MFVQHFLVYVLLFHRNGQEFQYVGITGVLQGQTDRKAIEVRKSFHVESPKAWVRGAEHGGLSMRIVATGLTLSAALLLEVRESVCRLYEVVFNLVSCPLLAAFFG